MQEYILAIASLAQLKIKRAKRKTTSLNERLVQAKERLLQIEKKRDVVVAKATKLANLLAQRVIKNK